MDTIPIHSLDKYEGQPTDFGLFLHFLFDEPTIDDTLAAYHVGGTENGDVVFPYIDSQFRLRTAKVMKYDSTTGKRVKGKPCAVRWIHTSMMKHHELPETFVPSLCLFGEHLLANPETSALLVGIVESEKTAIICACYHPSIIWLATGGKSNFNPNNLRALAGRSVIIFPDVDGADEWAQQARESLPKSCSVQIMTPDLLGDEWTLYRIAHHPRLRKFYADRMAHADIADFIIHERIGGEVLCTWMRSAADDYIKRCIREQVPPMSTPSTPEGFAYWMTMHFPRLAAMPHHLTLADYDDLVASCNGEVAIVQGAMYDAEMCLVSHDYATVADAIRANYLPVSARIAAEEKAVIGTSAEDIAAAIRSTLKTPSSWSGK